jgi:hypothetical protein
MDRNIYVRLSVVFVRLFTFLVTLHIVLRICMHSFHSLKELSQSQITVKCTLNAWDLKPRNKHITIRAVCIYERTSVLWCFHLHTQGDTNFAGN